MPASDTSINRASRSCDACQIRKIRCQRDGPLEIIGNVASRPCVTCHRWGKPCSYLRERKRRGRQAVQLSLLEEQHRQALPHLVGSSGNKQGSSSGSQHVANGVDAHNIFRQDVELDDIGASDANSPHQMEISDDFRSSWGHQDFTQPASFPEVENELGNMFEESLEGVLSRALATRLITIYFTHVYGIIPLIHQPSFLASWNDRLDLRSPQHRALVLAVVAATLVHLPVGFIPDIDMHSVSRRSLLACEKIMWDHRDVVNVDTFCIKYLILVVHVKHGNASQKAAVMGELTGLILQQGYHLESTYAGLDPIETERRRRVWSLIHNADKFDAVDMNQPVMFPSDDFRSLNNARFPIELDDECITSSGLLPSLTAVPVLTGLNTLTRIVTILGDILRLERGALRNRPSTPDLVLDKLRETTTISASIRTIATTLPAPFHLQNNDVSPPASSTWHDLFSSEVDLFVGNPAAYVDSTEAEKYQVLKANIHVTLALTRLRLLLYKEYLLDIFGPVGHPSRVFAEIQATELGQLPETRNGVYSGLLRALHSIPLKALVINGPSLVSKVRLVALTLLDTAMKQDVPTAEEQGKISYFLDFLTILTSIENQAPSTTEQNTLIGG